MTNEEKNKKDREYRLKNKEKVSEQQKKWYLKNKEKKREYNKKYRLKNKEKIRQQQQRYNEENRDKIQQYYEENRDKILERSKQYYEDNKEKILESGKLYRENNKDKIKRRDWLYNLKQYNITQEEYYEMFDKQNGCCKICNTHQSELKSSLHIDHNHLTNKIRGLLCNKCNQGLGLFNDNIILLTNSINYLKEND